MNGKLNEVIIDNCFLIRNIERLETEHYEGSATINITIKLKNTYINTKIPKENVLYIHECE